MAEFADRSRRFGERVRYGYRLIEMSERSEAWMRDPKVPA
jgi:hypothetical protein